MKIKDVDKVFYSITKAARELVSAERATLFLANAKDHVLWSKVAEGASGRIEVPFGKGLVGDSFKHSRSIKVDDTSQDKRFAGKKHSSNDFVTKALLCAPVYTSENLKYGVLQVLNKTTAGRNKQNSGDAKFSDEDLEQLEQFSHKIGSVVQNWMNYFDTVQRMNLELDSAIESEGKMVRLIQFILKCGGDHLDTNLQTIGDISMEDIIYMLPAERTAENEKAASMIQALYRGKKQRELMKEEHPELYRKLFVKE